MIAAALRGTLIVTGIVLITVPVGGQVTQTQTGRELDANFLVGSGGYNATRGYGRRFNSQLYVTGQVTGLGTFRGSVGYRAPDQLGLDLPSASLSSFRRSSVGLTDLSAQVPFRPAPYYERTTTVFGIPQITRGGTAPGSNVPRRSVAPLALAQKLFVDATAEYRPLVPSAPIVIPTVPSGIGKVASPAGPRKPLLPLGRRPDLVCPPLLDTEDREQLAEELRDLYRHDTMVDQQLKAEVDATRGIELPPRDVELEEEQKAQAALEGREVRPGLTLPPEVHAEETLPPPNQDVYVDLLVRMRERRMKTLSARKPTEQLGAFALDESAESLKRSPRATHLREIKAIGGEGANLVVISPENQIIIRGLAGTSSDEFNKYMNRAKEYLDDGRHYEAARQYRLAMIIDSKNPLPRLGQGLAYFVAGEPLTAGINLRRALESFPPIMEMRLDVPMMMDAIAFQRQLDRIDKRLKKEGRKADPLVLFVATFMHYSVGNLQVAKYYAVRLHTLSDPDDKLFRAYATFVLTGKRPVEQAATKPAR
jgi:hypothetical protein